MFRRIPQAPSLETSAFAGNPLIASVLRENVRIQGERAIIPLWPHWPELLREAHSFGRVLSISRNSHAVLGRIGAYPAIVSASCGHCARDVDGAMEFYFSRWNRAAVVAGAADGKWLYAVEFQDAAHDTLHKICLTADSDFEAFQAWVEINQATTVENLHEPEMRAFDCGAPPQASGEVLFLAPSAVGALFGRLIDGQLPAHVVVGNEGFVQGAELQPEKSRVGGQWIFLSSETCGLHLRHGRLAEVCLQRVTWREDVWVLKAYEPEGRLACVIAPPYESDFAAWDRLLLQTTAAHRITNQPS